MSIERVNIGIFGRMNAGKSSVMNLITQQNTSITDSTPGTTADSKSTLYELHGMGPTRIFDTAGIDERGRLGEKKRQKTLNILKESDLALIIIDPSAKEFSIENNLLETARDLDKQILIIFNLFNNQDDSFNKRAIPLSRFYRDISITATDARYRKSMIEFILRNFEKLDNPVPVIPNVSKDRYYILNIPMDEETPNGRYLRPQSMCEEYLTRNWAYPTSYRMDLTTARSNVDDSKNPERKRFDSFLNNFKERPELIITDSQAIDIADRWCPKDIQLTTFSILMANHFSGGRLKLFVEGLKAIKELNKQSKILIVEACNHSRIAEDIGTVQIPKIINARFPGVKVEHNFGREFQNNQQLSNYSLIIHCGGCMISRQKMTARIRDLENLGLPFTNYGLFLSKMQSVKTLNRTLTPFDLHVE